MGLLVVLVFFCSGFVPAAASPGDTLFQAPAVWDLYLDFPYAEVMDSLYAHDSTDTYLPCEFSAAGQGLDSVGVRLKGFSSMFGHPGDKKPFKLKFNAFREEQDFLGLHKLNLNNGFKDPTFLREKLAYDFLNQFVPSSRANYARVYLNGEYWGLYTMVEQVDKVFVQDRFGGGEDGNLFKGDPHGTLEWRGSDPAAYYDQYELKTNESENDWSDLVNFIDVLNHTSDENFPDSLDLVFQSGNWRLFLAANCLLVNLDSYAGSGHNYYLYHRDDNGLFIHLPWDLNEAFGNFNMGLGLYQLIHLPVDWLPPGQPRPLCARTYFHPELRTYYESHLSDLAENYYREDWFFPRIDSLADLIRDAVYADTRKMYSNQQFESNRDYNLGSIPGLKPFIHQRRVSVLNQVGGSEPLPELKLNEFLAANTGVLADEAGEYDDWVEIHYDVEASFNLGFCYLTDDFSDPTKWSFPDTLVEGEGYLLVWLDNDPEQGPLHAGFKLDADGEELALIYQDGITPLDSVSFGPQRTDISRGRWPDGDGSWYFFAEPSPGTANPVPVNLPPWFTAAVHTPLYPGPEDSVTFNALVEDESGVVSVVLWWDGGDGWESLELPETDPGIFRNVLPPFTAETTVNYYFTAEDDSQAVTNFPENAPDSLLSFTVSAAPCSTPALINEFLASNDTVFPDEFGEYDDWVELFNPTTCELNINGLYLTDDFDNPTKFRIILETDSLLLPGELLLIWCDNDPEQGPLHTNFKLSAGGEELGILFSDGETWMDSLTFGAQQTDVSRARIPDGGQNWEYCTSPTPGSYNGGGWVSDLAITLEGTGVVLCWSPVPGATGYRIYRSDQPYGPFTEVDSTAETSWSTVVAERTCWYRVTAEY